MSQESTTDDSRYDVLPELTGRTLADYQIQRRLGRGAMAEVYLAQQTSLERPVAFKVLHARLANDRVYVQRFHNEARAAASLINANIVQIYEVGEIDGIHFIAQEYVDGQNVGQAIQAGGALPPGRVIEILYQVAAALDKANQQGWVHRDIKPENIMLARNGDVKVADFGLARAQTGGVGLTQVGMTMGTPLYMSPEQIEGGQLDIRSDLYSLGVTAYHMLSGEPPFRGDTALAVAVQHLNKSAVALRDKDASVPSALSDIVHRLLAKKPVDRFASPHDLMAALRVAAAEGAAAGWSKSPAEWSATPLAATPVPAPQPTSRLGELMRASSELTQAPGTRWRWLLAAGTMLALGACLGLWSRTPSLLSGTRATGVEACESPHAQLYQAKMIDTEAAWQAVERYFPADHPQHDELCAQLARQGLIRYYLYQARDYRRALGELRRFPPPDEPFDALEAFTIAASALAHQGLDEPREAERYRNQLDSELRDVLREYDPRLEQALQRSP